MAFLHGRLLYKNITSILDCRSPVFPMAGCFNSSIGKTGFANQQTLTVDFKDVKTITQRFCQELLCPLLTEFGADFLKSKLIVINLSDVNEKLMRSAFKNLDNYFDKLSEVHYQGCDEEIYAMNQTWLIKAREIARENPVLTELVLGIADDAMRTALVHLSLEDIQFIARSTWLCFTPRFSSEFLMNINTEQPPILEAMLGLTGPICCEDDPC